MTAKLLDTSKYNSSYTLFLIVNLVISINLRFPFMRRISSNWRSSQTLLTSFWLKKEGISLFHAQLPLFGPPWEVPFEFPIYQSICVLFSKIFPLSLTSSSRVVSGGFFYLSAFILFFLSLEFLKNRTLSAIIFLVYLFLPYNIYFSTEILVDYFSVAMALGYIYWIKKFMDSPNKFIFFFLAIIFGCLGATIKITTMAIVIIPAILIAFDGILKWGFHLSDMKTPKVLIAKIREQILPLILLTAIAILPIFSVVSWTKYADGVKQASVFTAGLTSKNLTAWIYGTLAQKLNFQNWLNLLINIKNSFFLDGNILLLPMLGVVYLYRFPRKSRTYFLAALSSVPLTIFIFFNLYRHSYYYIAVSAYLSILIGFGLYCLYEFILAQNMGALREILKILFVGILTMFILMTGFDQYKTYLDEVEASGDYTNSEIIPLAKTAANLTPENEYIISFQNDWYPDFFLYSERKGLVIYPNNYSEYSCDLIDKYKYSTIVVIDRPLNTPELIGILQCFKNVELVEPGVYKVSQ